MKITIANTKGGVAKTTSAMMLATVLSDAGMSVEVWDADPQGSATRWAMVAEENREPLNFEVLAVNQVSAARPVPRRIDMVLVDTSPNAANISQAAVETSDLTVIPTGASPDDLARTVKTLEVVQNIGCQARVLLTQAEPHTVPFRDAVQRLREVGAPLLEEVAVKAVRIRDEAVRRPRRTFGYDAIARELGLLA
ncbi:plasmid partitioning protein ParA [Dermabacter hominis 1368]|uniref:CobQ/CobB/MinD/ParA nucleotide binding domain-containing protein n=2 Tax=Dermabacter TaxID=36739 RepID=A0A1B0ZJ34_9MICO|nr:ParA family protein [Dermabacter vaginalis]ANP27957.1 hypothetical protein DAD186_14070 [Dermabacter vaginalis]KDS93455.1 plasmid partitioning protein ParA [Dermabacter hominis 1368]